MATKSEIYNSVLSRLKQATFYTVSFDPETKVMKGGTEIKYSAFTLNEFRTRWSPDSHRKTDLILKKEEWLWELNLQFETEVDSEEFEKSWEETPLYAGGYAIILAQAEYTIPPRQLENTGSRIKYTLTALNLGA